MEVKYLVYASIISADNPSYTEDQKQDVIARFKADEEDFDHKNWKFILAPVDNNGKLAELFDYEK